MKETILSLLKTKFSGVPEKILDRIATSKAKTITTAEQANSYAEGAALETVFEYWGDARATEAANTAIANAQRTPTQPVNKEAEPIIGAKPEFMQIIEKQNEQIANLTKLVGGVATAMTASQKTQTAKEAFVSSKLPQKWFNRIDVNSEVSIEDQIKDLQTEYTELRQGVIDSMVGEGDYTPKAESKELSEKEYVEMFDAGNKPSSVGVIDLGL